MCKFHDSIFGIDIDGDGDMDNIDDMIILELLDDANDEE